jgi:hypothetical protein
MAYAKTLESSSRKILMLREYTKGEGANGLFANHQKQKVDVGMGELIHTVQMLVVPVNSTNVLTPRRSGFYGVPRIGRRSVVVNG